MAKVIEFDQHLNKKTGREALSLKLGYIVKIIKGELPYSEYGNPVKFFSYDNSGLDTYITESLARSGIDAQVSITEKGRATVISGEISYEGDI